MSTVAFAIRTAHPAAAPYFIQCPLEPIAPAGSNNFLTIAKTVELADSSFETLLKAIAASTRKKGTIIIVCHGNESGLKLDVARGLGLDAGVIRVLRANLAGQMDDVEAAKLMRFGNFSAGANPAGVAQLRKLKAVLETVRQLQLSRVELRACTTGRNQEALRQLQYIFNADLCCAPDAWDTFGPIPVKEFTSNPTTWAEFRKKHPGAIIVGTGNQRFSFAYTVDVDKLTVTLDAIADSAEAVDVWVKSHLPPQRTYTGGALFYHGLTADKKTIIFAGDADFRSHLVVVTDGKGAVTANPGVLDPRRMP
jgi:hypothetical protein